MASSIEKLIKLFEHDIGQIRRETPVIDPDFLKPRKLIVNLEIINAERNLKEMHIKLMKLKKVDKIQAKVTDVAQYRYDEQLKHVEQLKKNREQEFFTIGLREKIEQQLSLIERAEIEYTYHSKMLALLETYRKTWESLRGPLRQQKRELSSQH
jgi:DNA repair exonuclease SbcCD ATPase subunit